MRRSLADEYNVPSFLITLGALMLDRDVENDELGLSGRLDAAAQLELII